jgi:hypothetical protein
VVEEREWHVLVREVDGSQSRYVYKSSAGELPPKRDDIIEIDPLTKVVVLDIEPKEPRPGEIGIIRGRPPKEER